MATTEAKVPDTAMLTPIHQRLAGKKLLPGEHLVDSGYPSAELITDTARCSRSRWCRRCCWITRRKPGPALGMTRPRSPSISATCPQGATSSTWTTCRHHDTEAIVVSWSQHTCVPCPVHQLCTSGRRRQITLRSRELHEALRDARAEQTTQQWKIRYAARAGVEATMRQATHITGTRQARYLGLPKTTLEHTLAATAITMIRLDEPKLGPTSAAHPAVVAHCRGGSVSATIAPRCPMTAGSPLVVSRAVWCSASALISAPSNTI